MAGDNDEDEGPEPRSASEPLRGWERSVALVAGALTLGAGGVATFRTGNGAGSAVLIVVGAALLLVGIQGTPLIRVGGDSASIELERRRLVDRVVARATSESSPAIARSLLEAVSEVDTGLRSYPANVAAAIYGMQVRETCLRLGGLYVSEGFVDSGVDFTVTFEAHHDVHIVVAYFGSDSGGRTTRKLEATYQRVLGASALLPVIAVVDALPTDWERRLREFAPSSRELLRESLVKWGGPADDPSLKHAFEEAIAKSIDAGWGSDHPDGAPARRPRPE